MSFLAWSLEAANAVLDQTCDQPGPVLISLQQLQRKFGYVPAEAVALVAKACNVSRAEVHGVLTFYHDLRTTPAPENLVSICVAEACQAVGSRELVTDLEKALRVEMGNSDEKVELAPAFCFGNCSLGPTAKVNGVLIGRATCESVVARI